MDSNEKTLNMEISLRKAALIAGIGLLIMVFTAPIAEFYVFPKLINYKNAEETSQNIINNRMFFVTGIFLHLITLICDVVVAWALYVFLKPVNKSLSLLTAWFRLVFTAVSLVALLNLVKVLGYLSTYDYLQGIEKEQLYTNVLFSIKSSNLEWAIGFIFFGFYLGLLGYLVFISKYIPKIFGILLIIAGLGYLIDNVKPFLFPNFNTEFLMITFFGELIFMVWLLIKGVKIQMPSEELS